MCEECMPVVGCGMSGAPGILQRPSGHPAPPHLGGSERTCCRWGWAASCGHHPEKTCVNVWLSVTCISY